MRALLLPVVLALVGFAPCSYANAPSFKKVMIVIFENTNLQDAESAPFISQLGQQGVAFTDFSAETHPSQPNYIALVSGSTQGVIWDLDVNLNVSHLGDLLEQHGRSWKVYAEGYPGNCFLGSSSGNYYRKHVPFISFTNIQNDPARCARIVNATELDSDIAAGSLPDFSLFIPNINDDAHNTDMTYADNWLASAFGKRLQDPAFMNDMLFVVTFDESATYLGDSIFTVFYGPNVLPGTTVSTPANHYSILRTIEDAFALGTLGRNDETAAAIQGIWK
jgi:phospholipase C